MQDDSELEPSPDLRPLVVRALRRSNVRKKIASEIAYNIKTTPTNVIGAIRGMQSRYREDESLLSLNIVEIKSGSGGREIKLYGLTPFGKEMIESIKNRR